MWLMKNHACGFCLVTRNWWSFEPLRFLITWIKISRNTLVSKGTKIQPQGGWHTILLGVLKSLRCWWWKLMVRTVRTCKKITYKSPGSEQVCPIDVSADLIYFRVWTFIQNFDSIPIKIFLGFDYPKQLFYHYLARKTYFDKGRFCLIYAVFCFF